MAAQEKNIKLLQELLVRIEARRRKQDGSIPEGVQVSLMDAAEPSSPEEEIPYMPEEFEVKAEAEPSAAPRLVAAHPDSEPTEELDISPELMEAMTAPEAEEAEEEAGPAPSQAFEEEEVGEVTDKVQVIPPIPLKMEATALPGPPPKEEAAVEIDAEAEFPEVEAEAAVPAVEAAVPAVEAASPEAEAAPPAAEAAPPAAEAAAPVVEAAPPAAEAAPPAAEAPMPAALEGAPPFKEVRPFHTTGQPAVIPKPTIGQLLQKAFQVGEHREEQ